MTTSFDTDVCIVGGGPGGAMLSLLLARDGVDVTLVEMVSDYSRNREFRGDSITVGCVCLLERLGVFDNLDLDQFTKVEHMVQYDEGERVFSFDFRKLDLNHRFGWMDLPQPVLLNELVRQAGKYHNFRHLTGTKCTTLRESEQGIIGVGCVSGDKQLEIKSRLVIGADGRHSPVARMAGLDGHKTFINKDVVWFKLPRPEGWGNVCRVKMRLDKNLAILPTYPDLLRVAYRIPKKAYGQLRKQNISSFHAAVAELEPAFKGLLEDHVKTWSDTTLLDIFMTERPSWSRNGLLLIGDAAHTVSPITGQGVNLAIQDAVKVAPVITAELTKNAGAIVPARTFAAFERTRKKEIQFVTRIQTIQEWMLSCRSAPMVMLRRLVLWIRDRHPRKNQVAFKLFYKAGS